MKKILVMAKSSDMGGIEKSLIEFLRFLISENHEVSLYLVNLPGVLFDEIPEGVKIISPGAYPDALSEVTLRNTPEYLIFKIAERTGWHGLYSVIAKGKFDVAVSYGHNSPVPYLLIDKVKADKKILFFMHGEYCPPQTVRKKDEKYFSRYDYIVTDSKSNKRMLGGEFPGLAERMRVVYNIIDEEKIRSMASETDVFEHHRREGIPVFCTVGRISEEKGQLNALKGALILHKKGYDFRWYFIGGGLEYEKECRSFIRDNGLEDKCIMTGTLSNVYTYMSQCDLYVQPSRIEASGISIREAAVLGCRIIATDIPAFRELEASLQGIEICNPTPEGIALEVGRFLDMKDKPAKESGNLSMISSNEEGKRMLRELLK